MSLDRVVELAAGVAAWAGAALAIPLYVWLLVARFPNPRKGRR